MLPELGHFALILALLLAAAQAFFGIAGPALGRERWTRGGAPRRSPVSSSWWRPAVGCLMHAFVDNDFSVRYVAENSNSALPLFYRVTAVWGAHEGSLLLWILLLALWTVAVALGARAPAAALRARACSGVLGVVSFGFLLFTLATSNPFAAPGSAGARRQRPESDPAGLRRSPIHPPILYTGYVGFAVSFAFACAAMLEGRRDQTLGALDASLDRRSPGRSSPAASRWAAGGPTTSSAGAASGSGIRWRMPRSCRGWSARR